MTSDPDLEAKTRFSPRSILDDSFLGEGVCSVEVGGWVPAQAALKGGERVEGGCTLLLVTCPSWKRVETLAFPK